MHAHVHTPEVRACVPRGRPTAVIGSVLKTGLGQRLIRERWRPEGRGSFTSAAVSPICLYPGDQALTDLAPPSVGV